MWRRKQRALDELDQDIREHIAREAQDNIDRGMLAEEAHFAALRKFGNVTRAKEETREVWLTVWLEQLWQDIRFSLRTLRKSPGFTAVAILTLALGIGANTAIFTLVKSMLLDGLPVRAADRLVVLWIDNLQQGWSRIGPTGQDFFDWRAQQNSFDDLFLFEHGTGTVTGNGEPEQVAGLRVTTNFGDFFGIAPVLGRTFRADEATARHNYVILGYQYWKRTYASNPSVIGRGMMLNAEAYTIIGVLPPEFNTLFSSDVIVPFDNDKLMHADSDLGVFGRLKPGVTLAQASSEMNVIMARIAQKRPERKGYGAVLVPLESARVEFIRPALLVLLGAVGFVLLIACVNVANLVLSRAVGREREVALRMALGAGRGRLVRQFLTESTLLAMIGGGAGLLLAVWATYLMVRFLPSQIPVPNAADKATLPAIHTGTPVYIFTVLISLFAGLVLVLIPAFQSLRCKVSDSLKAGGRGFFSSLRGNRTRTALVIVEGAVAFILVIGAGLMMKSFSKLLAASPGFNPSHLVTMRIKLADDAQTSPYKDPWNRAAAFQKFLAGIEAVPGVQSAAVAEIVPLSQDDMDMGFFVIEEAAPLPVGAHLAADFRDVSPDYFGTMRIPLEQGRAFAEGDARDKPRVVIIDEALAREFFPGQSPIGKHVRVPNAASPDREIVGVVGSVRDTGFDQKPRPTIYFPYLQSPDQSMTVVVRSSLPPSAILPVIKNAVWAVDKDQPIFNVRTMDEIISGITLAQRIAFFTMNIFAVLALALASIGIYGVTSYTIGQRTREIGIRMALGAKPNSVMRLVLVQGIVPALWGIGIGVIAAVGLTRIMASLLYGVSATDPLTFVGVVLLLAVVSLGACYIPARRAMRVDPMVALRHE